MSTPITRVVAHGTFRVRKRASRGWDHDDFRSAEAAAARLATATPGATFVVMQEVACVRVPAKAERP